MAVWLLPGQGAQEPGMGAGLLNLPQVAEVFAIGSRELDLDLAYLATEGTADQVNDAYAAQALTMAVSVGLGCELMDRGIFPDALVGFSLGQISALALADVLPIEQAFALLKVRSQAMAKACAEQPGAMLALLGANVEDAEALAEEQAGEGVLVAANHNAPGQVVLSGTEDVIVRAQEAWAAGGKRAVRLNTAGAFHSPLMADAAATLGAACAQWDFADPAVPLFCNTDAQLFAASEAAERLERQVKQPVLFQESIQALLAQGSTDFVEVGHGKVLTGLVKRIDRKSARAQVGTAEQLEEYAAAATGTAQTDKEA